MDPNLDPNPNRVSLFHSRKIPENLPKLLYLNACWGLFSQSDPSCCEGTGASIVYPEDPFGASIDSAGSRVI